MKEAKTERAKMLVEEIEDMTATIKKIKGESYTNSLLIFLNVFNLCAATSALFGDRASESAVDLLDKLSGDILNDILDRLADVLISTVPGEIDAIICQKEQHRILRAALVNDVQMLIRKQKEYTRKAG